MTTPLRLILIEHVEADALALLRVLRQGGYDLTCRRIKTAEALAAALAEQQWDIIIATYDQAPFGGLDTLSLLQNSDLDLPCIIISDTDGVEAAVTAIKAGAHNYIKKDELARLVAVVEQEVSEAALRREQQPAPELASVAAPAALNGPASEEISERRQARAELAQRAAQLMLINDIGGRIAAVLELDRVLTRTARLVQETFDYHHVALFLLDGQVLRLKAVAGSYKSFFPSDHVQLISEGINGWVVTNGQKIVANDVSADPRYTSLIAEHSVTRAELCLPIKVADNTVGVLDIQSPQLNAFAENDVIAMETLTHQVAVAIENARLYEAIQQELNERREVEALLHLQATALEAAANGIVITDPAGTILWVNPAFTNLTGYSAKEALGQTPRILRSEAHDESFYRDLWQTILSGKVWHDTVINRRKDGTIFTEDQTITPVVDEHNEIRYFIAIKQDITDRNEAEMALRKSEERFRQVITSISDHIYVTEVTADGRRLNRYISPNVHNLTGYPLENFTTNWSFWPSIVIHPDDRRAAAEQGDRLAQGHNSEMEYRMIRADGEIIWVRDSGRVEATPTSNIIYGVVSDITESKRAQEQIIRLYIAERERYQEAEALRQAALALASTIDLDQVIESILVELQNVVPYDSVSAQLMQGDRMKIIGGRGFPNLSDVIGISLPTQGNTPIAEVLASMTPVIVGDVRKKYTRFMEEPYAATGTRSWLGVPLCIGPRTIGILTIDKREPDFYSEAHAKTALAYAAQAAVAIENARLHSETQQRAQQLAVMHELDRAISASLHLNDVFQAFSDYTGLLLAYDFMSIVLVAEDKLKVTYVSGLNKPPVGTRLSLETSRLGWVISHMKPLLIREAASDADLRSEPAWAKEIQSVMVLPLQFKRQTIGTWNIGSQQVGFYSSDDLHIAQLIADQLALGIENARLYHQAQQEIAERKQAQDMLEAERASLALRVGERTAELSAANAELARTARLKDEFLANMSHELRTPLNAILGMSQVLRNEVYGSLNGDQLDALEHIEEGGSHLLDLINDILDLSKIEAGKLELAIGPALVNVVCQASLLFIKQEAQKKRIKVVSEGDDSVDTIQADQRRLKQILVNLLSNAVKFTPDGGRVGLKVKYDQAQEVVHFTVWDTGIGISEEDMKHLFDPFVQIDSKLSRQHEGTGLGLSLVARLAELHGGGLFVESKEGQGSRFTVSLPWSMADNRAQVANGDPPTVEHESVPPAITGQQSAHVLFAEDNEVNIITVRDFLQAKGYRVTVARNGVEALERAKEERPNLILMDIQMPEMDGLEATRHLRTDDELNTVPVVALTALAMPGDRERCLAAGANEYLSKPVNLKRLVEVIEIQLQQVDGRNQAAELISPSK